MNLNAEIVTAHDEGFAVPRRTAVADAQLAAIAKQAIKLHSPEFISDWWSCALCGVQSIESAEDIRHMDSCALAPGIAPALPGETYSDSGLPPS